jgi:hypothetical protein
MQPTRPHPALYTRAASAFRNYTAAVWLNVALVSAVLTTSERARPPQVRVTAAQDAREHETVHLANGTAGIISARYADCQTTWEIEPN